eukprot:174862-Pyramimonas_sp.AAC.2
MQADIDKVIIEQFGELLNRAERGELDAWGELNPRAATALVVLLDQFSRHVYRNQVRTMVILNYESVSHSALLDTESGRVQIEENDKRALRLTYEVLKRGWETELPLPYQVFLLMPLRHTPTIERLRDVMERIGQMSD